MSTEQHRDPEESEPDPRWSLANERTFLAYNRTALALVVAGFAVSGSRGILDAPVWVHLVGVPLVGAGAWVAGASRGRFRQVQKAMRRGEPLPTPPMLALLPAAIVLVAVAGLVALLIWQP